MKLSAKGGNQENTLYRLYDRANDAWFKNGEWIQSRDKAQLMSKAEILAQFDETENNILWHPFGH